MAIGTITSAIDSSDGTEVETLATAVTEPAVPTGADGVLAHVFEPREFRDRRAELDETGRGADVSASRPRGRSSSAAPPRTSC